LDKQKKNTSKKGKEEAPTETNGLSWKAEREKKNQETGKR
jgi:hypothetical protein